MSAPHKLCPQCQQPSVLQASQCGHCGHQFRTQFVPPDQTQMFGQPPGNPPPNYGPYYPPPYQPPPQPQYGYANRPDCIQLPPGMHSPVTAMLFTFLLVGAGQMFNKQIIKGVVTLIVSMVLLVVTGCLAIFIIYPVAAIDAYQIGTKLNRGQPVGQWEWF